MKNFRFNKIWVIESLEEDEEKTGTKLYDDCISRIPYRHPSLKSDIKWLSSKTDWDGLMDSIEREAETGIIPLLHIEIHGEENGGGLVLNSGELISVEELCASFRRINKACGSNLFVTLAVCKGLWLMQGMTLDQPMPFCGAIGSFFDLNPYDIRLSYAEFYDRFADTFNIADAYTALVNANNYQGREYRYYSADEVFCNAYQGYLDNNCSAVAVAQRAVDTANEFLKKLSLEERANFIVDFMRLEKSLAERTEFIVDFMRLEDTKREEHFQDAATDYFMLNSFPENRDRFEVPEDFEALKKRYDNRLYQ